MGRATSGVKGMRFRDEDELLAADVIAAGTPAVESDDEGENDDGTLLTVAMSKPQRRARSRWW